MKSEAEIKKEIYISKRILKIEKYGIKIKE